jgi:glycosyltransferase involved in cell wall biosynthesis
VIYGSLAARKAGVPGRSALIPGLGQMFTSPGASGALKRAIAGALYRKALGAVDCVFVQNEDDEEFLRRIGAVTRQHHVTRIDGSGVDIERFDPPPLPSDPAFLFVARLVEEKGVAEFVEVARRVRAKVPEATFRVVGYFDGEGESRLRPLLDSAARDRAIEFVGRVEDIRPQIARSSVFVLPSRYREGIPRSALECLAMGRAIITTDWVGCRETVRRGERANGILVPIRDVDALERAALALATDPAMVARMGQESRRYAEERFDVRRVNKAIFEALGIAFPPLVEGARSAMAAL